jgi:hypothetical protein
MTDQFNAVFESSQDELNRVNFNLPTEEASEMLVLLFIVILLTMMFRLVILKL